MKLFIRNILLIIHLAYRLTSFESSLLCVTITRKEEREHTRSRVIFKTLMLLLFKVTLYQITKLPGQSSKSKHNGGCGWNILYLFTKFYGQSDRSIVVAIVSVGWCIQMNPCLIGKNSPCDGSGFSLSQTARSFTICPSLYNRKIKYIECFIT